MAAPPVLRPGIFTALFFYSKCSAWLHSPGPSGQIQLHQQGVDGDEASPETPHWSWARLLGRMFDLDMATCPFCRRGSLRIIAAITQEAVLTRILRHLKRTSVPPPIAPARAHQATFAWVASAHDVARGLGGDVSAAAGCLLRAGPLCAFAISFEIHPPSIPQPAFPEVFPRHHS